MNYYLAQANAAQMKGSLSCPIMEGMASQIQRINTLAESSAGFVWRIPSATNEQLNPIVDYLHGIEPERIFFNMSVWESVEALRQFTFESLHRSLLHRKVEWIIPSEDDSYVLLVNDNYSSLPATIKIPLFLVGDWR
jgi:hypothetical protein